MFNLKISCATALLISSIGILSGCSGESNSKPPSAEVPTAGQGASSDPGPVPGGQSEPEQAPEAPSGE